MGEWNRNRKLFSVPSGKPMANPNGRNSADLEPLTEAKMADGGNGGGSFDETSRNNFGGHMRGGNHRNHTMNAADYSAKTYQQLIQRCSFADGYIYERGFGAGFELFKYIARSDGPGRSLKMWIPDTVVYGLRRDGAPFWLYSDKNGVVKCTKSFNQKHMIEKIGNRRYEDDLIAVAKEPKYTTTPDDKVQYDGNETTVVSTRTLAQMMVEKNSFVGMPFIIQRYIKSKGGKACIVRAAKRAGKPSEAWLISNKARFSGKEEKNDRPVNERFITDLSVQHSATSYRLVGQAQAQFEAHNTELASFLEIVMRKRISEIVVDYLKDDFDQIWMLQIKAYRLQIENPERAIANENRSDDYSDDDEANGGKGPRTGHSGLFNRKCRFCSMVYPLEQLRYKMTTQMILDTASHLRARMSRSRYKEILFSQTGGYLGLDASRLYHAHRVCRTCFDLYHQEKELKVVEAKYARALGLDVPLEPVLDSSDDMLKCEEGQDNFYDQAHSPSTRRRGRGSLHSMRMAKHPSTHSLFGSPRVSPREGEIQSPLSGFQFTQATADGRNSILEQSQNNLDSPTHGANGRMNSIAAGVIRKAFRNNPNKQQNIGKDALDVSGSMPPEVTLCRFLIAVHELHDVPRKLVNESGPVDNDPLLLRFKVLNKEYDVPVALEKCKFSQYRNRMTSVLPLHVFRVFCFFSPDTPVHGSLSENSGIYQFLETQKAISVKLLKACRGGWMEIGSGNMSLQQFKSDYVKSVELYVPLGLNLELCQVKVSIGIERTRAKVDSTTVSGIKFCKGVYVPNSNYHTCDALPSEWMTALQVVNQDFYDSSSHSSSSSSYSSSDSSYEESYDEDEEDESDLKLPALSPEKRLSVINGPAATPILLKTKSVKYDNPLSPVPAAELSLDRKESFLFQRLQQEEEAAQRLGYPDLKSTGVVRGLSFRAPEKAEKSEFTKDLPEDATTEELEQHVQDLLKKKKKKRSRHKVPKHMKRGKHSKKGNVPPTLEIPSMSPTTSIEPEMEDVWCLRINIDYARNITVDQHHAQYKRWHAIYDLFGQSFRTHVSEISPPSTLPIKYSKKHYVWSTRSALESFFKNQKQLVIKLAHSMPIQEANRLEHIEEIFDLVDVDSNGCVTRNRILEALTPTTNKDGTSQDGESDAQNADGRSSERVLPEGYELPLSLASLGDSLKFYWKGGGNSLQEATTRSEFVAISLSILRIRAMYLTVCTKIANEEHCEPSQALETFTKEANGLFFPTHLNSVENQEARRVATVQKNGFLRMLRAKVEELDSNKATTKSCDGIHKRRGSRRKSSVSSVSYHPGSLTWHQVLELLRSAVQEAKTTMCHLQERDLVTPVEGDHVVFGASLSLSNLCLGNDMMDDTFDLKPIGEDGLPCLQRRQKLNAALKECISTFNARIVPLEEILSRFSKRFQDNHNDDEQDVVTFLQNYKGDPTLQPEAAKTEVQASPDETYSDDEFSDDEPLDQQAAESAEEESFEEGLYVDCKKLMQEFNDYQKTLDEVDPGQILFPAYIQVSMWLYRTETNGSALSPTKYAVTKINDRGEC